MRALRCPGAGTGGSSYFAVSSSTHSTSLTIQQTSPTPCVTRTLPSSPSQHPLFPFNQSPSNQVPRADTLTPRDRHPPRSGVLEPPLRSAYLCAGPRRGRAGGGGGGGGGGSTTGARRAAVRRAEPASPRAAAREQRASGVCVLCACRARVERVPCASRGHRRSCADAEGWCGCVSVCAGAETDMCF